MQTFRIQISTAKPAAKLLMNGQDLINALQADLQQKNGGNCHGLATEGSITFEVNCERREEVMQIIDSFFQKLSKSVPELKLAVLDTVPHPLSPEHRSLATSFNAMPTKLTLKFFQSLSADVFIASNLIANRNTPIFAEIVAPVEFRMEQWARIQACGAAQRNCRVFKTEAAFERWRAAWD